MAVEHIGLESGRASVSAHAREPHVPRRHRLDARLADVGYHVGCQVGAGVVQFVQQLLLHRMLIDDAAGAFGLEDGAVAVGIDRRDRVAQLREAGHVLEAGVGIVAAANLRATFEQVASHRRAGQPCPVVGSPAVMRHCGADRERGVGDPSGDDDIGTAAQSLRDALGTEIDVGARDREPRVAFTKALAQRLGQQPVVLGAREVVATHYGQARLPCTEFTRQRQHALRGTARVGRAEVAYDADAAGQAVGQHRRQHLFKQRLIAGLGVGGARQLRQRERAFGQRFEDQHRRPAVREQRIDHRASGVGAVAGEAGGRTDPQGLLGHSVHDVQWPL